MAQGTLTWTFAYDAAGNRTRLTHPNGTSTDYAYLNNHWLASITDKAPGGATFQSTSYTYDPNGNRASQADSSGTTTFAYDALNRLTQAAYPGGYGIYSWTYDAVGNRTQQTAPSGTTNYAYDANSRLLTAGSTTYAYDANGNLLSISTGQTFAWDVFNQMTQATGAGGTVTHTYNGDGLKTRRVGPDGTRQYYYDGIRPIWETDAAGAMTAQYDRDIFGNLLSRREASGARRYYHFDGLGSTTALTNESGAATSTLLYDAWGNQRASTGSDQGRYRFSGAELDQATGLYHMGARFYDPTIGRWLSEDPVAPDFFDPATLSFYAYTGNNPMLNIDPRGTQESNTSNNTNDAQKKAQEVLERIARELGITVERLLEMMNELNAWFGKNADKIGQVGAVLSAVAAGLSALALAAYAGVITGAAAAIIIGAAAFAGLVGAIAVTVATGIQLARGQISPGRAAFNLVTGWAGLTIPGMATRTVAQAARGLPSAGQSLGVAAWGLHRAWGMGGWVFGWR